MASEATPTNTTEVNIDAPSDIHTPTATTPTAQQQPQAGISDFISDASSTTQVRPGGAPARFYLNDKVVPYLLEGMKTIARDQPSDPLRVLGEYLIQKSNEVESNATGPNDNTTE